MIFEQIRIGGDRNFAYLIGSRRGGRGAIVDPGYAPDLLAAHATHHQLTIDFVCNTHGHPDHCGENDALVRLTGGRLAAFGRGDRPLGDDDLLHLEELAVRVIHTPGHTPDSICLLAAGKLVTGDTLFVGKVGGTHREEDARAEYDALHQKLCVLPPETEVWPGHDYGVRPSSTIGDEIRTNPFLLQPDFESFLSLKRNWAEYKKQHGIA